MLFKFSPSYFAISVLTILVGLLVGCSDQPEEQSESAPETFPTSHALERQKLIGPESCVDCHSDEVESWKQSHHAHANRPVSVELDRSAFTPAREVVESGVTYRLSEEDGLFYLDVVQEQASPQRYDIVGVIGTMPLRQYLAKLPGNKLQTISASYDVVEDRWFDVFAGEDRLPGEWGHWTGQGMNWNANCAYCHTTEYQKNYDFTHNRYESTWTQQGLACAECHTDLEAHVSAARKGEYQPVEQTKLSRSQIDQNCASCHSRRDQLTADAFKTGDNFHDHFALSLPDQPGLYHPDGQILDEVFVYGSFMTSRMGHAGISCLDCHNPHTLEPILPIENNLLCMRCHEAGGGMEAPIIQPVQHSFHAEGSTGNQCVSCHMPKNTYMQVDPRADHGFLHPDPLMTRELGIPNACSQCHADQTVDWAVEHAEAWYGDRLEQSPQRKRARALSQAYAFSEQALDMLIDLAQDEAIPAWRATYAGLAGNYLPNPEAINFLESLREDPSPMVRTRVTAALGNLENTSAWLMDTLSDPTRSVRITAARSLTSRGIDIPDTQNDAEWQNYLNFHTDRPQVLFMMAMEAAREQRKSEAQTYVARALLLDAANATMYQQAAIILSTAGLNEAATRYLYTGWEKAPNDPQFPYSLGLLAAESGDLQKAVGFLEETVAMEPQFYRAWYNLSLAYRQLNMPEKAEQAMQRALGED